MCPTVIRSLITLELSSGQGRKYVLFALQDETSEAGAVNTATGPSTADGLDPVAEQNRMRQEIRERMSKPLSARPGRIAPSTDTNKRDSMSPIVTKPPPPPPRKRPEATVAVKGGVFFYKA